MAGKHVRRKLRRNSAGRGTKMGVILGDPISCDGSHVKSHENDEVSWVMDIYSQKQVSQWLIIQLFPDGGAGQTSFAGLRYRRRTRPSAVYVIVVLN